MTYEYLETTAGQTSFPKTLKYPLGDNSYTLDADGTVKRWLIKLLGDPGEWSNMDDVSATITMPLSEGDRVVDLWDMIGNTFFSTHLGKLYSFRTERFGDPAKKNEFTNRSSDFLIPTTVPQLFEFPSTERFKFLYRPSIHECIFITTASTTGPEKIYALGKNHLVEWDASGKFVPRVKYLLGLSNSEECVRTPELMLELNKDEVVQAITSDADRCTCIFSVSIKTNQRTLVYGTNENGELGLGHSQAVMRPTLLAASVEPSATGTGVHFAAPIASSSGATTAFAKRESIRSMI